MYFYLMTDLYFVYFVDIIVWIQAEEQEQNGVHEVTWSVKVTDASKDGEVIKYTLQTKTVRLYRLNHEQSFCDSICWLAVQK